MNSYYINGRKKEQKGDSVKNNLNGIINEGTQKKKLTTFPIHYLKIHTQSSFSSSIIKSSLKTISRPEHQSASKDFNRIGVEFVQEFGHNFDFGFGF